MSWLLLITGLGLVHMVLRCWPIWAHRDQGCDAYYYLLCAEDFSRRRRLPIVLPPYYLLEPQDQAYPPLMSVLLGLLPGRWLKRYYWLITPLIDFASAAILSLWIGARFGPAPAVLAVLAYSANASLVAEFSALTSRALALFECNGFVLATFLWTQGWAPGLWIAAVLMALLLYTHKLSIQLLWVLVPFLALSLGDWRWFVPFAAGYCAAFGLAPRYFLRVLYAHYDIVRYWRRNWPLLNAHMIRQSPLYGRAAAAGFYRRHDVAWLGRQIAKSLDYNCFVLFAPLAAARWPVLAPVDRFALLWCVGTVACGLATYFVPGLRCFGEGNKYFKYALAPSLMLAASSVLDDGDAASIALLLFCAGWTLYSYRAVWHWLDGHLLTTGRLPPELRAVLSHCRSESRIMCLPPHFADIIAYHLRCSVMWGGHNYEFKRLQPFYPVLLQRIESFVEEFALTHLVLDEAYVRLDELCLTEGAVQARAGSFVLVEFGKSEGPLAAAR